MGCNIQATGFFRISRRFSLLVTSMLLRATQRCLCDVHLSSPYGTDLQARAQRALDPARRNAADVAAHAAARQQREMVAIAKLSKGLQSKPEHKRGTLDASIHTQARKVMHGIDMGLYQS